MGRVVGAVALVVVLAALAGGAWYVRGLAARVEIGAGYVAKQLCSCVFVGDRSVESCRADLRPDTARIRAEFTEGDRGVRAWVPLLGERRAHWSPDTGCVLD